MEVLSTTILAHILATISEKKGLHGPYEELTPEIRQAYRNHANEILEELDSQFEILKAIGENA